jgi:hypothetical protein
MAPCTLDIKRERYIVAHQLEARMADQVLDVALGAGEEVIDADDVVPLGNEAVTQVRTEEAGASGDQDALAV